MSMTAGKLTFATFPYACVHIHIYNAAVLSEIIYRILSLVLYTCSRILCGRSTKSYIRYARQGQAL